MKNVPCTLPRNTGWSPPTAGTIPANVKSSCNNHFKNHDRVDVREFNEEISLTGFERYILEFDLTSFDIKKGDFAFISIYSKSALATTKAQWHDYQIRSGNGEAPMACGNGIEKSDKDKSLKTITSYTDLSIFRNQTIKIRFMVERKKNSSSFFEFDEVRITGISSNLIKIISAIESKVANQSFQLDPNPPDGTTGPRKPPGE